MKQASGNRCLAVAKCNLIKIQETAAATNKNQKDAFSLKKNIVCWEAQQPEEGLVCSPVITAPPRLGVGVGWGGWGGRAGREARRPS